MKNLFLTILVIIEKSQEELLKKEVLKKFTLGGILWTLVIGTLSHFFYQWSGENFLIGLLSPVNETVWEHLKLLFFPALLYMLAEKAWLEERYPGRFCENLRGLWAGLAVMPVLYYGYTLFTGRDYLWADIGIFVISVLTAFLVLYFYRNRPVGSCSLRRNLLVLFVLLILFFLVSVAFMR